jgi:hypothetical protein
MTRVDQVELMFDQHLDEHGDGTGMIGVVPINENVNVGVYISKHPSNYVALALPRLRTDDSARCNRHFNRAVRRVVVIDVYRSGGKSGAEVAYNSLDRAFFIVTRDENRDCNAEWVLRRLRSGVPRSGRLMEAGANRHGQYSFDLMLSGDALGWVF